MEDASIIGDVASNASPAQPMEEITAFRPPIEYPHPSGPVQDISTIMDHYEQGQPHYMFFDSSYDGQGLVEDLDWLFSWPTNDLVTSDTSAMAALWPPEVAGTPPGSVVSSHSIAAQQEPFLTTGGWFDIAIAVKSLLHSLPQQALQSNFFEAGPLETFYASYFSGYNSHFPILHQASLVPGDISPLLLVAILALGATLSTNEEHFTIAQQVHDVLRWLIFSEDAFQPPAPLWCLQALLLVQAHGKMFSSRKHHELAHIFHGSIITLMRRGSSYTDAWTEELTATPSLQRSWHHWIEEESSRRAAYFAFIMDAQHSSVFGHEPALSVSDLRLPLPSSETLWDANTASRWQRERSRLKSDPPLFLQTLRGLLAKKPLPVTLSPFARFVVLHGLFSITKHMQARDLTASDVEGERATADSLSDGDAGVSSSSNSTWRQVLDRAIETWSLSLLFQEPSLCLEAARPLQRMAHVTIHVNLVDFHILAGAPSLTGNKLAASEHARAKYRLNTWRDSPAAKRTLSQCLLLIQETMFVRNHYRAAEDNIALRPWCLYHATLILWAYGVLTAPQQGGLNSTMTAEEYIVHMLNELMGGSERLQSAQHTAGLILSVRDALKSCRWELLKEAYATLDRLIQPS